MYLTKIQIEKRNALRKYLFDNYRWHQVLWKSFNTDKRPFLFRVESKENEFHVFLLSSCKPEIQTWGAWETKRVSSQALNGNHYRFYLRANPTVKKPRFEEDGTRMKQGKRIVAEDFDAWLKRKSELCGFAIQEYRITRVRRYVTRKGSHVGVDYEGCLKVTDPKKFKEAVTHGIGSAKAYGFGLMLVKKVA